MPLIVLTRHWPRVRAQESVAADKEMHTFTAMLLGMNPDPQKKIK
jgi:hypothetical protein